MAVQPRVPAGYQKGGEWTRSRQAAGPRAGTPTGRTLSAREMREAQRTREELNRTKPYLLIDAQTGKYLGDRFKTEEEAIKAAREQADPPYFIPGVYGPSPDNIHADEDGNAVIWDAESGSL